MKRRTLLQSIPAAAFLRGTSWMSFNPRELADRERPGRDEKAASLQSSTTVYELRVYHTYEGKLEDLLRRFREHTMGLFEKHGIKNLGYWTPLDEPLKGKTLVYMLEHPSRSAAEVNWKAFRDDPEWQNVRDRSEANGKLVEKIESTFLALTDFSPPLH